MKTSETIKQIEVKEFTEVKPRKKRYNPRRESIKSEIQEILDQVSYLNKTAGNTYTVNQLKKALGLVKKL